MAEEFGPWIQHDGKGCPVVGLCVQIASAGGHIAVGIPTPKCDRPSSDSWSAWVYSSIPEGWSHLAIVRYRLRRPDALRRLIEIAEDPSKGLPPRFPVEELA